MLFTASEGVHGSVQISGHCLLMGRIDEGEASHIEGGSVDDGEMVVNKGTNRVLDLERL